MIVLGIFLFILLVVIHEYGHFLVAKRNGVEVEEFGIGFPPKIIGKKMGKGIFESYYTINLLPLGGFVRLKGEEDAATEKGSFGAASLWAKLKITLAGVVMNFLAAAVILTGLAAWQTPSFIEGQYFIPSQTTIVEHPQLELFEELDLSPAAQIGIQDSDRLISFNGEAYGPGDVFFEIFDELAGQDVDVEIERNGERLILPTTFNPPETNCRSLTDSSGAAILDDDGQAVEPLNCSFGAAPDVLLYNTSIWSAPGVGVVHTYQIATATFGGLWTAVSSLVAGDTEAATAQVAGPVGIFSILNNVSDIGLSPLLFFISTISVALAVMNTLPIPALDGGRAAVMLLFRAIKKPLSSSLEQKIHGAGIAFLLALMALITIVDIGRFF